MLSKTVAPEDSVGPPEFVFLPTESREAQLFGWVLMAVGAILMAVALILVSRGAGLPNVGVFGVSATVLVLGALAFVGPRPLRMHRWAFMPPTVGCLGRIAFRRWIRYDEVAKITVITTSSGASYVKVQTGDVEVEVPQFMVGEEGLRRLREKVAPERTTFEGPPDSPVSSAGG